MLSFDREKCVNCRMCEEVCSYRFSDRVQPNIAAIRIDRDEGRWGLPKASVCDLCGGSPVCVDTCPEGALDLVNGVVAWDEDKCTSCLECVEACPRSAVAYDDEDRRINICDLCGGQPLCVQWCPEGVITLQ